MCTRVYTLREKVRNIFVLLGLENVKVTLQELILGYKIYYEQYNWVNFILLVFAFTVYKGHLISENRTKKFDYWNLFKYELNGGQIV